MLSLNVCRIQRIGIRNYTKISIRIGNLTGIEIGIGKNCGIGMTLL